MRLHLALQCHQPTLQFRGFGSNDLIHGCRELFSEICGSLRNQIDLKKAGIDEADILWVCEIQMIQLIAELNDRSGDFFEIECVKTSIVPISGRKTAIIPARQMINWE